MVAIWCKKGPVLYILEITSWCLRVLRIIVKMAISEGSNKHSLTYYQAPTATPTQSKDY